MRSSQNADAGYHLVFIRKLFTEGHYPGRQLLLQQALQQRLGQLERVARVAALAHANTENNAEGAHERLLLLLAHTKRLHAVVQPEAGRFTFSLPWKKKQWRMAIGVQRFLHEQTQPVLRQSTSIHS